MRFMPPATGRALAVVAGLALAMLGCSDDARLVDARAPSDAAIPGQFSLTWSVAHSGAALTCASIAASTVSVDLVAKDALFGVVDSWPCTSGSGTTRDLAPGLYEVRVSLLGTSTLAGPVISRDLLIVSGQVAAIAPVAFDVDPSGTLKFRISTGTNGNCTAVAQQGAGITATTIELRDNVGACVPTRFQIAAGASLPAGTYVSDCAGATFACIATDQDVSADAVAAGQHSMVISGDIGASRCWRRTSQFTVRAAGQTTTLNPQLLAYDPAVPGCPAM